MAITEKTTPDGVSGVNNTQAEAQAASMGQTMNNNMGNHTGATYQEQQPMYGFGTAPVMFMSDNLGSEYTNKFAENLNKAYATLPAAERPKVNVLDKEVIRKLAYSTIVVSMKSKDIVNYYTIVLETTGRKPLTSGEIMAEINSYSKQGQTPPIYTTDEAINIPLHEEIRKALSAEHGQVKFVSVDGLVVPAGHDEENISIRIAAIAFSACKAEKIMIEGTAQDLNIRAAKSQTPNMFLKLESNLLKGTIRNEVESAVRSDWQVELDIVNTASNMQTLNLEESKVPLAITTGYVDAIPENTTISVMPGQPPVTGVRLHPHIVIASNSVFAPTPGYALLGLISALVMTNENMWLAAVAPKDDKKSMRNVGALNILTNLENSQNGVGTVLDLSTKTLSTDEVYDTLKRMFLLDPVVSYDIESYGTETHYSSMFALAAQPGESKVKIAAAKQIISAANHLTDGAFPADYPIHEIFVDSGVIVPLGTWSDKTGERDIRDIDAAFVATQTQDPKMVYTWALSNIPNNNGMDPYLTKVDLISKLIPDAVITGKASRVTFKANFINTLIQSAMAAGLDATYEPAIKFVETTNLNVMSTYIQGAGVSNAAGFARQTSVQNGHMYNTPYTNVGYGRAW